MRKAWSERLERGGPLLTVETEGNGDSRSTNAYLFYLGQFHWFTSQESCTGVLFRTVALVFYNQDSFTGVFVMTIAQMCRLLFCGDPCASVSTSIRSLKCYGCFGIKGCLGFFKRKKPLIFQWVRIVQLRPSAEVFHISWLLQNFTSHHFWDAHVCAGVRASASSLTYMNPAVFSPAAY